MHDLGEGAGEGGVFVVADAVGDFADTHGGIEQAITGGSDFGVHDEALGRGAEVGAEPAF